MRASPIFAAPLAVPHVDAATLHKLARLGVRDRRDLSLCHPDALTQRWLELEGHPYPAGLRRAFAQAVDAARRNPSASPDRVPALGTH